PALHAAQPAVGVVRPAYGDRPGPIRGGASYGVSVTILDDAREGMDLSVRPQDDLFGHMNGTWLRTEEIPADKSAWGPFAMLADQSEAQVRTIIEELAASKGEPGSEAQKIGDMFASFMDTDAVNARGAEPLKPYLAK